MAGANPQDAGSYLKLEVVTSAPGVVTLRFEAKAERGYSLLKAGAPDSVIWFSVTNFPSVTSNRLIAVPQPASGVQYFRVTAPVKP